MAIYLAQMMMERPSILVQYPNLTSRLSIPPIGPEVDNKEPFLTPRLSSADLQGAGVVGSHFVITYALALLSLKCAGLV